MIYHIDWHPLVPKPVFQVLCPCLQYTVIRRSPSVFRLRQVRNLLDERRALEHHVKYSLYESSAHCSGNLSKFLLELYVSWPMLMKKCKVRHAVLSNLVYHKDSRDLWHGVAKSPTARNALLRWMKCCCGFDIMYAAHNIERLETTFAGQNIVSNYCNWHP